MSEEYKRSMNTITMNADWLANYEQELREQIAKEIENMEYEENMHHTRRETIIVKAYWEEAKLEAARIARGQK